MTQPTPVARPRRPDPGLLVAVALGLVMAWALIVRPSLPTLGDARLHVFRAAEFGRILRGGTMLPRWSPRFYLGYGYPLFAYYAPLTYWLANLLTLAIPGGAVLGVKGVLVGGFVAAGAGAYGLGRLLWGERPGSTAAGLLAAASFVTAPYVARIDVFVLGHLPEFVALALAPGVLWALAAYANRPARWRLVGASLLGAGLLLAHNLQGTMLFAFGAAWLGWAEGLLPLLRRERTLGDSARRLLPLALAPLLASVFWVPLLAERSAVQLGNLVGGTGSYFDYRAHFLTVSELFGASLPLDPARLNPEVAFNLGVGQWILALLGGGWLAVSLARGGDARRRALDALPWLAAALALPALTLPASDALWQAVTPMQFLQFPWRLLGPAALMLAAVGAYAGGWLAMLPERARGLALGVAVVGVLAFAPPTFVPTGWGPVGGTDALAVYRFELLGRQVGTTATGDFLPVAVRSVPAPHPQLAAGFEQGVLPERVPYADMPDGVLAEQTANSPTDWTFRVDSPEGVTLPVLGFEWAGWRATVDGARVPITPSDPGGLITVTVPPGAHTVRVWLGPTPARTIGAIVSLVGVLALAFAAWRLPLAEGQMRAAALWREAAPAFAALALFVAVAGVGAAFDWFQPRSSGVTALGAAHLQHAYFEGGVDLVGYTLDTAEAIPGDEVAVTLYWRAREPVAGDYSPFLHVTTTPQHTYAQADSLHPGNIPTRTWPPGKFVADTHTLATPPGTPPGDFTLRVGLWQPAAGRRQLVLAEDGTVLGDALDLAVPLRVAAGDTAARPPTDDLAEAAPGMWLADATREPEGAFGDAVGLLKLTLLWQAEAGDLPRYDTALRLLDADGAEVMRAVEPVTDGLHPPDAWQAGEQVRDVHGFFLDESMPPGSYRIEVGLVPPGEGEPVRWIEAGGFERTLP